MNSEPPAIATAADLYREMKKRGLHLRGGAGRDDAILVELRAALGCPLDAAPQKFLDAHPEISAAAFLRAFARAAQPFARMFQEIWAFFAECAASHAGESIRVRIGLDGDPAAEDLDVDTFRRYAERAARLSSAAVWSRVALDSLIPEGWRLLEDLGLHARKHYCSLPRYEMHKPYSVPRQPNLWVSQSGSGSSPRPWYRAISACS